MTEPIDRLETMEQLADLVFDKPNGDYFKGVSDAQDVVAKMPTIEPMQWIPCSSGRMPEDLEEVNITWVNHDPAPYYDAIKDKPFTAPAIYYKGKWYWWTQYAKDLLMEYGERCNIDPMMYTDEAIEVIAWCELPVPYKGGDVEHE